MRKVTLIVSMIVAVLGMNVVTAGAQATNSCTITNTGPSSNNTCSVDTSNVVTVVCTNGVDVNNLTSQSAVSGSVSANGNTVVGTATSGDAANVNTVATELAQACLAAAPPRPVTPTPDTGNEEPAPSKPRVVSSLPDTGENPLLEQAALATAAATGLGLALHAGISAYRRHALKN